MSDADRINAYPKEATIKEIIVAECDHYGLPHSIDALLRHIYNNRDTTLGAKDYHIKLLEEKLRAEEDQLAALREWLDQGSASGGNR